MKTIAILSLVIIFTSCSQGKKPVSDSKDIGSASSETAELSNLAFVSDTTAISVVNPVLPERKITVGGANADLQGFTSEAIQNAIDALHNSGNNGTVILLPGTYDIIAPVRLYDNMTLEGSGESTILKKCKGVRSPFSLDADYGELQITVADVSGFKTGMGVAFYDENQRSGWDLTTAKIT